MRTITDLKQQKRNKERVNVFLDGNYAFSVTMATAGALHIGQSLTPEEIDLMQAGDEVERAKQSAYRFLSYRPRSTDETRQNLRNKGYDESVIERVINRLAETNHLNDWSFAQYWVEQRETFKPRSRMALRQELYQKGLSRDIVEKTVDEIDEEAAARRAGGKKAARWARLPEEEFFRKMSGFLRRRGFSYAIVTATTKELWEQYASDDGSI